MLIEFTVGNYRSFKEPVTFSMVATTLGSKYPELDEHNLFQWGKHSLLKSAAVYGANASGKSNLIQALAFMRKFVLRSSNETQIIDLIKVEPFRLSSETDEAPSFFEAVFALNDKIYRYGFELTSQQVVAEWLFHTKAKETKVFSRQGHQFDDFQISQTFSEGKNILKVLHDGKETGDDLVRPNALFLSVLAQLLGKLSVEILKWFANMVLIAGEQDFPYKMVTAERMSSEKNLEKEITNFLRGLDLSLHHIRVDKRKVVEHNLPSDMPDELRSILINQGFSETNIYTTHLKYNENQQIIGEVEFDLEENESKGTQKLFALSGFILRALQKGQILVIDEFDTNLHPLLTREIIQLFNSNKTNSHQAQLIFTTHDTNLLSNKLFRRDQIWFTEKDRYGVSTLFSLAEYKVRREANFEEDYITGRYGAIPFIGDLSNLVEDL